MSDVTVNPTPVSDPGTGLYPMTRPDEVTVEAPVSNVSTGAVSGPPDEVTVDFPAGGEPTGAHPTPESQAVYQWPGTPPEDEPDAKSVSEAENAVVEPDAADNKSVQPAKAARTRKGK